MFKLLVFKTDSKDFNQGTKLNWKANLFVLTEAWLYENLPKFAYDLPSHKLCHAHNHYWKKFACVCFQPQINSSRQ